jgi:hypothetical protein
MDKIEAQEGASERRRRQHREETPSRESFASFALCTRRVLHFCGARSATRTPRMQLTNERAACVPIPGGVKNKRNR